MSKKVQFNKGLLTLEKNNITLELPTSEVHCVSHEELDYLKNEIHFAFTLNKLEQIDKHLYLSWKIPQGYKPISSVFNEAEWFKLKTANSLLDVVEFFENHSDFTTVYELENLFVDQHHNVKVAFYTNSFHLPVKYGNNEEVIEDIKKIIARLLTSLSAKRVETILSEKNAKDNNNEPQTTMEVIVNAVTLQELKQMVEIECDHFLAQQDERQVGQDLKMKQKQRGIVIGFMGFLIIIIGVWYFSSNTKGDLTPKVEEMEETIEQQELMIENYQDHISAYEAFYNGDPEKSLKVAKQVNKTSDDLDDSFYIELLVQNGMAEEAIKQFPEQTNVIVSRSAELKKQDTIKELELDDPYVQFEQAIIAKDNDSLREIIPKLEKPTDRQTQLTFEYYLEDNVDEAIEYAQKQENNEWEIKALESKVKSLDKKKDKKEISKIEEKIKELSD